MVYEALADAVVVVHFAFLIFVAVGGILAWRWPALIWLHVPAVAYGVGIVTIGWVCPLTPLEQWLRELAGEGEYSEGFVDHYIEGVLYPERYTPILRAVVVGLIVVGWYGFARRHRTRRKKARTSSTNSPGCSKAAKWPPLSSSFQ